MGARGIAAIAGAVLVAMAFEPTTNHYGQNRLRTFRSCGWINCR